MREALIVDAVRSPIGKRNGSLSKIRADELAGQVLNGLVGRNELDPAEIEDIQMGCVSQVGEQGWNIGRMAPLVAGWPDSVCGTTIDRQCGSSMQGNFNAAAAVSAGQLDLVVSAGGEAMSPGPMGSSGGDLSDKRLERAEKLAALKPAFLPEGKITAGNSSQICDGAAAVLVASEAAASRLGLEPRARFVSFGLAGVDPHRMLHGNPEACEKALARAGVGWDDIAVVEVNEAFASVVLQFVRDAGLEERMDDVNPNGGGISLGHPLGATGARITATLVNELERREAQYGVATMCIGFGQAIAAVIERL